MLTQYEKLKDILREMFQMDQADLDFGIYRIMNAKRDEIEKFLDDDLLPQVKSEFAKYRGTEIEEKKKELSQLEATLRDSGMNPDDSPKVKGIREELAKYGDDEALTNEVFSHLTSFFRRYYDGGDFLSLRRYKKDTYAIPYEGEEVKLHWANADQYYIKTSEYLKDYAFKLPGGKKAHFKLVEATQEKDNIKTAAGKERKFRIHEDEPIQIDGQEVFIRFVYLPEKEKQDALNKKTVEFINSEATKKLNDFPELFAAAPTAKNANRTLWEKHLTSYTARFNFDFFIHKDLGGFLRRELDFYIKNEVLYVDDLDGQDERQLKSAVAKIKVIKHIALKIIAFLAQLEDFQKKLWLKKKFVVNCGYCVTLDRVPEELYPEIAQNESQREEWVSLFAINEIEADLSKPGYTKPLTIEFLKANPYLVLDTKHFDAKFKEKLLAIFDNLDANLNGLLIQGDNFHALNLLQALYREQINCTYIDPPYNTDASAIIYKNNFKDSSWLSLVHNRIELVHGLMRKDSIICVAIDDQEVASLRQVMDGIFEKVIGVSVVKSNPQSRKTTGKFSPVHEYAIFYGKTDEAMPCSIGSNGSKAARYPLIDEKGRFSWMNFIRAGNNDRREDRPKLFYPIAVNKDKRIRIPKMTWIEELQEYKLLEEIDADEKLIYPIKYSDGKAIEKNWQRGHKRVSEEYEEYRVRRDNNGDINIDFKTRMDEEAAPVTWWDKGEYASANYGAAELKDLFGEKNFDFPKAKKLVEDALRACGASNYNSIVIDFFGGSGTTGHATINLNREDGGKRKYILIEMGEHFDTVLKPRIQKVIYSKDWKDGKPVSRDGISHMFKYMYLESYDDTLDNLKAIRTKDQETLLEKMSAGAHEDYTLSYMLNVETKASYSLLNIDRFIDPFNYTLKIRRDNELKDEKIDLVETFNYLIGLYVEQTETIRGFKVVRGKLRTGEKTLVIWRNTQDKSNEALDEFFQKQKYNTLDFEFDLIFVNGDNNLENLKVGDEKWKVRLIEEEFKKRMWEETA